jgi:diguanylate cyclase (GGDEF)-like protein
VRRSEAMFAQLLSLGIWPSVIFVTSTSIVLSLLITIAMFRLLGIADRTYWHSAILTATLAALSIAGGVSTVMMLLFLNLTNSRAVAHILATTDSLTGLPNRRQFRERAELEFAKCQRYGVPLSIALLDVDHFKRINDSHGHGCGDTVLREIARACSQAVRSVDLVARYGGEEFVVLLPHTDLRDAAQTVERIRSLIADLKISGSTHGVLNVTASAGVAGWRCEHETLAELIDAADAALYRAKRNGRNRVEIHAVEPRQS